MRAVVRRILGGLLLALLGAVGSGAQAGPITLLVGYSAGGSADFVARIMAAELSTRLGRAVIVENAAGASGMIALQRLVNASADGNTTYFGGFDTVTVPMVNPKVKIDWRRDTVPVGRTTTMPMVWVVPNDAPYRDLAGMIAAAKKEPGGISYGTPGVATAQRFLGEIVSSRGGVELLLVPYRGGAQIMTDLIGGNLSSAVAVLSTALPYVRQGQVHALAIFDKARSPQLPDVPAATETAGFEGVSMPLWQGIFVKTGTPQAFVGELAAAIEAALASPDVQKRLSDAGFTPAPLGPAEFASFIEGETRTYEQIIKAAGITAEE
jgi:tripartite-type tricarboxylate transporter receptor subunit TctC